MQISPTTLLTILGMAIVTYGTRAGGLWAMSRVGTSPRVEAWFQQIPGAVLISIVVPAALAGGPPEWIASLVTALVAARTRNLLFAMALGIAAVWVLRRLLV